jgi:signal transduction histidine kinase
MNLVTIIWSAVASVCLTLAAMNLLVWLKKRTARANLLISVMAAATAVTAFFELSMMLAGTPEAYGRFMRWVQLPVWMVVVSLVLFMRQYLRAGRPWLAWTVCGMRTLSLVLNFVFFPNLYYREIFSLEHMRFLGETISIAKGVSNPWMLTAQASTLLLVVYVIDAALAVHRKGGSRGAVLLSGTIMFFVTASLIHAALVFWWRVPVPVTISFYSLGLVAAIAYEMSLELQRAAQLSDDLRQNEAALRSSKKDLEQLAGRLISAQEEELRRLSRELHDDLTQRLAVLAINAGKLELDVNKTPGRCPEIASTAAQIKEELIKVSEDVHTISRQIHPTILDDLGLVRAIESECSSVMGRHTVEIAFRKEHVPDEIPDNIALCLYRIVQEGLRNVTTHSAAKNCVVSLKGDDHALLLTLSDDGVGFDPLEVRKLPGLGLSSMRERVQLIQGDFSIRSQPGQGAVITVRVPLAGGAV